MLSSSSLMVRPFSWQDLRNFRGEFAVSDSEWVCLSSKSDATQVYCRALKSKNGLSEFLVEGSLPLGCDAYFAINMDHEHRPEWDTSCVAMEEIETLKADGPAEFRRTIY